MVAGLGVDISKVNREYIESRRGDQPSIRIAASGRSRGSTVAWRPPL